MKWLRLLGKFIGELVVGALRVAWLVVQPAPRLRPGIVAYPMALRGDAKITLFANMITLTPGTLSIDVSDDKSTLFIHALDVPDPEKLVDELKTGFETRVREAFK